MFFSRGQQKHPLIHRECRCSETQRRPAGTCRHMQICADRHADLHLPRHLLHQCLRQLLMRLCVELM
ncbi:hypothetical protein Q8A67_014122 [Cirrhinus molitorella]|uniref:Uncharacterized protein n=1 Tax=Cirrhinus molitorella TaxID=172907 RepID=A0AA88TME3_9TELE|nr:hypothetical protein Q8A67_014122 [Cirrhinus molitorella]